MLHDLLRIGPHITALPIIHGSGDFALEVRRVMLNHTFDCVAVPLPPSFQEDVEQELVGDLAWRTLGLRERDQSGWDDHVQPDRRGGGLCGRALGESG